MTLTEILQSAVVLAKYTKPVRLFPRGPWRYELDVVIWYHQDKLCAVLRNAEVGTLNGYVEAPMDARSKHLHVHGGITFHEQLCGTAEHADLLDGHSFLGFGCAHAGDLIPSLTEFPVITGIPLEYAWGVYRDLDYVVMETKKMATQLYGP